MTALANEIARDHGLLSFTGGGGKRGFTCLCGESYEVPFTNAGDLDPHALHVAEVTEAAVTRRPTVADIITSVDELVDDVVFRDSMGDIGVVKSRMVHYPEAAYLEPKYVLKHYSPLTVLYRPDTPPAAPVDERTGQTAEEWAAWSNGLASLLPEEYDGDEAQEVLTERFIRDHAVPASPVADDERLRIARVLFDAAGFSDARVRLTAMEVNHAPTPDALFEAVKDHWLVYADAILAAGYRRTPASTATVEAAVEVMDEAIWKRSPHLSSDQNDAIRSEGRAVLRTAARALADAGLLRAPIPRALFDQALSDYRQAWHAADAAGREGERSREGLLAALTTVGVEVSERG